ncbi:MAG TPA: NADH-quinone oxidoreductase subunit N [Myxococcota bacterium]|nr:NADH-quinone oxidoreductase subunit N [Myxococcota bacterium]
MANFTSLGFIVPELVLGGTAVLLFLLSAAARRPANWHKVAFPALALFGLACALAILLVAPDASGAGANCSHGGCKLFFGLLASDPLSVFFRLLCITATIVCVFLSLGSPSLPKENSGEYHGLLLVLAMGMCLLSASNHLLMIYVGLETVSLCSYLLTGWDLRKARSREASLKYVLYGGVASGVMLFGMTLLYGLFGDLSLQGLHSAISSTVVLGSAAGQWATLVGIVFVLAGLGYKVAAAPFHMWCPDVYEGAPTPFTALLSVGPKAAGFALMLRFFYGIFLLPGSSDNLIPAADVVPWVMVIGIMSAVTMTIGNFAAIVQNNLKRLLAYSSIAHAGYVLMGVTAGGRDGFEAVSIYMAVYLLMNMGAFAVVSAIDRSSGSEEMHVYRGLGRRAPLLGIVMGLFLLSLAGLPPTAGFVGKLYLFAALIHRGGYWFDALAVIGVINSVISLYYYARVLKAMYFERDSGDLPAVNQKSSAAAVATVLAVPTLALGIFWQPLAQVARWSASFFH